MPRVEAAALYAAAVGDGDRDGEEEWRERPRSRAADLTRRASLGSLTPPFPVSMSVQSRDGGNAFMTMQTAASIACRTDG